MKQRVLSSICFVVFCALLTACGGSAPVVEERPTQPVVEPDPIPEPPAAEHIYYQVYWDDIHVLTIYRGSGVLRSEESNNPNDVFTGSCDYMTASSHYFEKERDLAALVSEADSIEVFFELLEREGNYLVEEGYLEEGY